MAMHGFNFTERVRTVLAMAREEAARLRHEYVGTEHVLLGLVREGEGVAAAALTGLGVQLDEVPMLVEAIVGPGRARGPVGPDLPYTTRAKKVLELAMSEAREQSHPYVGTEHLLMGLLREEKGIGAQVLATRGVTIEAARAEIARLLGPEVLAGRAEIMQQMREQIATHRGPGLTRGRPPSGDEHPLAIVVHEVGAVLNGHGAEGARHPGLAQLRAAIPALHRALPDVAAEPADAFASGDRVAMRWRVRGTHQGSLYGIAPTGQPIELDFICLARVEGDRVVALDGVASWLDVLISLGVLTREPPPR